MQSLNNHFHLSPHLLTCTLLSLNIAVAEVAMMELPTMAVYAGRQHSDHVHHTVKKSTYEYLF